MSGRGQVRFGGGEIDGVFRFELTGGMPALDFANTLDERGRVPVERLVSFDRLIDWGVQAGLLAATEAAQLRVHAAADPHQAERVLTRARALRETIFGLVHALNRLECVDPRDLNRFNASVAEAARHTSLVQAGNGLRWDYPCGLPRLDAVLWPVARSAVELLTSAALIGRLRVCAGEGCAWLFLDFSPKQNRRWCDMSVCGNRAKLRRYRGRQVADR